MSRWVFSCVCSAGCGFDAFVDKKLKLGQNDKLFVYMRIIVLYRKYLFILFLRILKSAYKGWIFDFHSPE